MAWERLLITVSNIGTDLNLSTVGQVICLLATQVVAFGGSLVFAKLSKKYDTVQLILVCIAGLFYRLPVCADLKEPDRFQFSGIRCGMLPGIHPVPVEIVLFQDHSTG